MSIVDIVTHASMAFGGGAVGVKIVDVFRKREQSTAAAKTEQVEITAKHEVELAGLNAGDKLLDRLIKRVEKLEGDREVDQTTIRGLVAQIGEQNAKIAAQERKIVDQARLIQDAEDREKGLEKRLSESEARNIQLHADNVDLRRGGSATSPSESTGRHGVIR